MDNNCLTTLASVCQFVPKIPVSTCSYQTAPAYLPPTPGYPEQTLNYPIHYGLTPPSHNGASLPQTPMTSYQNNTATYFSQPQLQPHLLQAPAPFDPFTSPYLTPPSTPNSTSASYEHIQTTQPVQVQDHTQDSDNPVLRNKAASEQYKLYLDETWPEGCTRRGASVIRASLYTKIAEALQDEESVKGRFKQWMRNSEFFLIECDQRGNERGGCLAVPAVKGRVMKNSKSNRHTMQSKRSHSYKLVARLEDFAHIIGTYHNDKKGHHGIRKTYSTIQEDFKYIPRAAVTKYIELCDICSLHRSKGSKHTKKQQRKENTPSKDSGNLSTVQNEGENVKSTDFIAQESATSTPSKGGTQTGYASTPQVSTEGGLTEVHLDSIIDYIAAVYKNQ